MEFPGSPCNGVSFPISTYLAIACPFVLARAHCSRQHVSYVCVARFILRSGKGEKKLRLRLPIILLFFMFPVKFLFVSFLCSQIRYKLSQFRSKIFRFWPTNRTIYYPNLSNREQFGLFINFYFLGSTRISYASLTRSLRFRSKKDWQKPKLRSSSYLSVFFICFVLLSSLHLISPSDFFQP